MCGADGGDGPAGEGPATGGAETATGSPVRGSACISRAFFFDVFVLRGDFPCAEVDWVTSAVLVLATIVSCGWTIPLPLPLAIGLRNVRSDQQQNIVKEILPALVGPVTEDS